MLTDQIGDFLTRVRNAGRARLTRVDTFNSKMNRGLCDILAKEGYIKSYKVVTEGNKTKLRIYLKFLNNNLRRPLIQGLVRQSKPGLRKYVRSERLPSIMSGMGLAVISTSKGLISDKEAKKLGLGGEYICSVW